MLEVVEDMDNSPFESVSIPSFDGCRLCGRLYHIREGGSFVIFFHGYHGVAAWDGYGFFKIWARRPAGTGSYSDIHVA
ncbi:MAG: hypothetical protein J6C84_00155 [Lachnospiraceae bacterium]|nr:hypothetical protein [Lachnospiraceae bacterium]